MRRYATVSYDTVAYTVKVPVIVPHDSVITIFKTDTTYLTKEKRQGRARITIVRTPQKTTVRADCDSTIIIKEKIVNIPTQSVHWGVNKWYKYGFWAMLITSLILALILFMQRFTFEVVIKKRIKKRGTFFEEEGV